MVQSTNYIGFENIFYRSSVHIQAQCRPNCLLGVQMRALVVLAGVIYFQSGIAGTSSQDVEDSAKPQSCISDVKSLRDYLATTATPHLYADGQFKPAEKAQVSAGLKVRAEAYDACLYSKTPSEDAIDYYQLSAQLGAFIDMLDWPEEQMVPVVLRVMDGKYQLLNSLTGRIVRSSDN